MSSFNVQQRHSSPVPVFSSSEDRCLTVSILLAYTAIFHLASPSPTCAILPQLPPYSSCLVDSEAADEHQIIYCSHFPSFGVLCQCCSHSSVSHFSGPLYEKDFANFRTSSKVPEDFARQWTRLQNSDLGLLTRPESGSDDQYDRA